MRLDVKYPCLVRKRDCKTKVHVSIEPEGLDKYGRHPEAIEADLLCNYQEKAKTVLTAEKKLIQVSGTALFPGDIAPDVPAISGGTLEVFGVKRRIAQGTKARNPDATVNYTKLEVV